MSSPNTATIRNCLGGAFMPALAFGLVLSVGVSILQIGISLYSLQIHDRVLPSGHMATLLLLSLAVGGSLVVMGLLDALRSILLQRLGTQCADRIARRMLGAATVTGASAGSALRELETARGIICGPPMQALFDLPWLPLAILAAAFLHPYLAVLASGAALTLILLGWLGSRATRPRLQRAHHLWTQAHDRAEAVSRHAEVVRSMGLLPHLEARFAQAHSRALLEYQRAGEAGAWLGGSARACRFLVQAGAMGMGAALVVAGDLTPGGLIAGSIIIARALAPAEQVLGSWKGLIQLRESVARLDAFLRDGHSDSRPMRLPAPTGQVTLENVTVAAADGKSLLRNISLELEPGTALAILGQSAAGKTTLCRLLAGCIAPTRGRIRLDGADYAHFEPASRGSHIGYLPQEPVLFPGTVVANIARMAIDPVPELVVLAARQAGVHDMILRLPKGYDTELDERGLPLSGGQRQRLGLARALYGSPRLVVLDEPNANLDAAGDAALVEALRALKADRSTVVFVTHRPSLAAHADQILVLEDGAIARHGPREEVMAELIRPVRAA